MLVERSLDMGALRARGVTPEQIIGYCAWIAKDGSKTLTIIEALKYIFKML